MKNHMNLQGEFWYYNVEAVCLNVLYPLQVSHWLILEHAELCIYWTEVNNSFIYKEHRGLVHFLLFPIS